MTGTEYTVANVQPCLTLTMASELRLLRLLIIMWRNCRTSIVFMLKDSTLLFVSSATATDDCPMARCIGKALFLTAYCFY